MTDEKKPDDEAQAEKDAPAAKKSKWSTGAKVGAAVGSAAVAAALIYAGRHQIRKHDDFKAVKDKPMPKYENEPDYDDGDPDIAADEGKAE
ncbi:hypothetical protein [Parasphingorhabdus sp.]|jgi:hypothetical protein|uniref:hypothetical protein n=1 Tax=Parasphingorhabdus sp. TaxID=2709688 RepID=UPI0007F45FA3|nr:hypothetical protein A8B75_03960 [Sphingomonadales bacterium EhC05]